MFCFCFVLYFIHVLLIFFLLLSRQQLFPCLSFFSLNSLALVFFLFCSSDLNMVHSFRFPNEVSPHFRHLLGQCVVIADASVFLMPSLLHSQILQFPTYVFRHICSVSPNYGIMGLESFYFPSVLSLALGAVPAMKRWSVNVYWITDWRAINEINRWILCLQVLIANDKDPCIPRKYIQFTKQGKIRGM